MRKKIKETLSDIPWWVWLCIVIALLIPVIVNFILCFIHIPSGDDLGSRDWLPFWGSYLGGFIGCIPALLAISESRRQSKIQSDESEKNRKLSVRPYVSVSYSPITVCPTDFSNYLYFSHLKAMTPRAFTAENFDRYFISFSTNSRRYIEIEVKNIGLGPALNVSITNDTGMFGYGNICSSDQKKSLLFLPELTEEPQTASFVLHYADIYHQSFFYKFSITYSQKGLLFSGLNEA